ncbi:MAG: Wzz/FepE/Etk N-terminal domain-containing protein [Mariniphaga sp.]
MNNFFDNQRILEVIWKRKFHFIVIGIVAVVLAAFFSGPAFIKPKFRSTARIYPTNIWVLSEESESEQMLEIINSRDIKQQVMEAFNLNEVYKVDRNSPYYMSYMLDIYNENVNASKTKFETVEIKVMDYDPQRASNMCDSIIRFYNKKVRNMHKAKDLEMVKLTENELNKKYTRLDTLAADLGVIRKEYGILDYTAQVERVTEGYMNALANGRMASGDARKIQDLYNNLAERGTQAYMLETMFNSTVSVIDSLNQVRDFYLSEFEKDITYAHIVEHPVPADKKAYPVRWIIVALTTLSAVFLALLVFLVLDYKKTT